MKICTVPFKAGAVHIFSNNKNLEGEMIIMRQLSYIIEPEAEGLSVNAYARNIAGLSRAFLRSVKFRENGILINGQRVTTRGVLHAGDSLVFNMPNDCTQGTAMFSICPTTVLRRLHRLRVLYLSLLKMKISRL